MFAFQILKLNPSVIIKKKFTLTWITRLLHTTNKVYYIIPIKIILSGWKMAWENHSNHEWVQPRVWDDKFYKCAWFLTDDFYDFVEKIIMLIARRWNKYY
jgi:hypothetical protein